MRARCRPTDVRFSGLDPSVGDRSLAARRVYIPPAPATRLFAAPAPLGSAPKSPATRPSAALPPDPRVPACAAPPHRARRPAPASPPRAGLRLGRCRPWPRPQGPLPSGAQALSLSPALRRPAPGGAGAPGRPAGAGRSWRAVAGRGRALWLPLRGSEPAGAERRVAEGAGRSKGPVPRRAGIFKCPA